MRSASTSISNSAACTCTLDGRRFPSSQLQPNSARTSSNRNMDALLQDVRFAIRTLVRTPGFSIVAIIALALGIGANTAIFTIVNAALIEPLPFKDPDRLVLVWESSARRPGRNNTVGPANYIRWRERATAFEDLSGFADTRAVMTGGGEPQEVTAQLVLGPMFQILGVPAMLGRTFTDAELANPTANVTV